MAGFMRLVSLGLTEMEHKLRFKKLESVNVKMKII